MRQPQLSAMVALVARLPEPICVEAAEGDTAWVNAAYCRFFGLPASDQGMLETTRAAAEAAAADRCGAPADWQARMSQLRHDAAPADADAFVAPDGTTIDRGYTPVVAGDKLLGHLWKYRDTSRRTKLEESLRQSQKLTTVGQLAGGIAHDFNNLLTAVVGYCDLLDAQFDTGDARRFDLHEIRNAAMRAASLTRQLLAFSRRQVMQPEIVDVALMLPELQKMLARLMGEQVTVSVDVPEASADVFADPGQIEQVMFTLAVNARDAMPDGGVFGITLALTTLEAADAEPLQVRPGRYVHIAVSDTGIGMDEGTRAHAFEPFFSTKPQGDRFGLGLGLPTAYGIVRQTGGAMAIDSAPGAGTTVHVYLPEHGTAITEEPSSSPAADAPADAPVADAGEFTVLVVEDESSVLRLVRRLLESEGLLVLSAQNADEALLLGDQHGGRIDLLLTDVVMPGMNGLGLADRFAAVRPGTPVLFMSGYADAVVVQREIIDAGRPFLQKPFAPDRLLARVREVLQRV